MPATLHRTTRVLEGGRISVDAPELTVGQTVRVTIEADLQDFQREPASSAMGVADYLRGLHRPTRSPEYWAELERSFQEERNAWDR